MYQGGLGGVDVTGYHSGPNLKFKLLIDGFLLL